MIELTQETIVAVLSVLLGTAESLRQYKRTGRFRISSLPLRSVKRLIYELRRVFFTIQTQHGQQAVDGSLTEFKDYCAARGYEPEWPLSYRYDGEDANLRRYFYNPEGKYPHRQVHVRAFERGGQVTIYAQEEPSALHHPIAHLRSNDMDTVTGWVKDQYASRGDLNPLEL